MIYTIWQSTAINWSLDHISAHQGNIISVSPFVVAAAAAPAAVSAAPTPTISIPVAAASVVTAGRPGSQPLFAVALRPAPILSWTYNS